MDIVMLRQAQTFGAQFFDDAHRFGGSDLSLMVAANIAFLVVAFTDPNFAAMC